MSNKPEDISSGKHDIIKKSIAVIIIVLALSAAIFHLYIASTGILEAFKMRTLHLMFLLPLSLLLYPIRKKGKFSEIGILDIVLALFTFLSIAYLSLYSYERLINRMPFISSLAPMDLVIGVFLIFIVLEATRRAVGWGMVIIVLVALLYTLFGKYIPGRFGHAGSNLLRLIETMSISTTGIFGLTTSASASFIFLFVLFGAFLKRSGAGQFFIDFAYSLTGNSKGGPAKMAVIASCLIGSVSGSSTANVTSTGAYTIPLMKKMGYEPSFAGAVESSASTGGMILPPVMGSVAFLMAEYVGIPYIKLCAAAAIPALLYFTSVGFAVHFEATRLGLAGVEGETPSWKKVVLERGYLAIPLFVIILTLILGLSAYRAALYGIISCVVLSYFKKETAFRLKDIVQTLIEGSKNAVMIAITCAAAGMVIGVTAETGIAVKFASLVIGISGGKMFLILPLIMLASLILGMGLPASAAYIMVASIAVPALIELNLNVMASHLFALYFGVFSGITPPVAIAAFAGAALAGSDPMKTGFRAVWLSLPAFIIPYVFILRNGLILEAPLPDILMTILTTAIGCIFISMGIIGCIHRKISLAERVIIIVTSIVFMLNPNLLIEAAMLLLMLGVYFRHRFSFHQEMKHKKEAVPIQ